MYFTVTIADDALQPERTPAPSKFANADRVGAPMPEIGIRPTSKTIKIFVVAGGCVGLLVLVAIALLGLVDPNAYKARLEATASSALGMEVKVGGPLRIRLFPGLLVTLADVHIRSRGTTLASASEAKIQIGLFALLQSEIAMTKIELKHPTISIERDLAGTFNFQKPETPNATIPALNLAEISISDGTLLYADKRSGAGFEARNCSGDVHHVRRPAGKPSGFMKELSLTAEIACGQIPKHEFSVSELKFSVDGASGVFDVEKITMRLFGARGSANIHADYSGAVPRYHVRYDLPQFHIEEFFETRLSQKVAEGRIDFSLDLSMHGKTLRELSETAAGHFSLGSENLTLVGTDVDREFSQYESSQNFNLVDIGALLIAGPFGLVVTKGYNFASILQGASGSTDIRTLVSEWKVENGIARAQDVAMATKENRIALRGELDFVHQQFNDVTVALIDADGCAKVQQEIRGTFQEPVLDKPNFLEAVAGPAVELLEKGTRLIPGGECQVFYAGSVTPP